MTDTEKTKLSEEETSVKKSKRSIISGYPMAKTNFILVTFVSVIAVFLLITTFRMNTGYQKLENTIENYIVWEQYVKNMELSSDYLTNEVRSFVETGNIEHLNLYFKEAEETRRRDEALEKIREYFSEESSVYKSLNAVMNSSLTLMFHEYAAMCLKLEAMGKDPLDYNPVLVSEDYISPEDSALSSAQKDELARELVFDSYYQQKKDEISGNVMVCMSQLKDEVTKQEVESSLTVENMLIMQHFWIVLLILSVAAIVVMNFLQIIRPLHRAVPLIRGDKQVPVEGASEFRLLAYAYNRMYEINREYKEKLRFRANHDQLTGALNRRGIEEILNDADLESVALLLIDIDFFKEINDSYGHSAGDRVLSNISKILQSEFRSEDVICRMGGDEFAIVMWRTGPEMKELISGKIKHVNELLCSGFDGMPSVSISVGVAFGGEHSDDIFNRADKALYKVKASGRANCAFYEDL